MGPSAHLLACPFPAYGPHCDPTANPYPLEYVVTLLFLAVGFAAWRRMRPPPQRVLRVYIASASAFAFVLLLVQTATTLGAYRETCRWILEACLLVTACLYLEMWLATRRARVPKAIVYRLVPRPEQPRTIPHHGAPLFGHVVADQSAQHDRAPAQPRPPGSRAAVLQHGGDELTAVHEVDTFDVEVVVEGAGP